MAQFSLCKKLNVLNSLCFPCLEKLTAKFPVFPVPWPPCIRSSIVFKSFLSVIIDNTKNAFYPRYQAKPSFLNPKFSDRRVTNARPHLYYLLDYATLGRISKCNDQEKNQLEPKLCKITALLHASFLSNACRSGWR